jgi:hypothetical protein
MGKRNGQVKLNSQVMGRVSGNKEGIEVGIIKEQED